MVLKALDIYKLLPRKNCKECGEPTCLTFAMKLAGGKGEVEKCPYLDDNAKKMLGTSTRPPVQLVKIGVGERSFAAGNEFFLYRHEKTFYHEPGIMIAISDRWAPERIRAVAARVRDERFTRIGADLRFNGVAIRNDSGSAEVFGTAVTLVEEIADIPEILMATDPAALEAGLAVCGNYRPLIHAAGPDNYQDYCRMAKKYGCPLVVKGAGLAGLDELSKNCAAEGVSRLVLDPSPGSLRDFIADATAIRQLAVTRQAPGLGYPVFLDTTAGKTQEAGIALGILKYASVIVTRDLPVPAMKAALTLRQNIYTDPQKPIQMTPGIYRVGTPGPDAPVLMTVNFSLTYFTVQGYLESSRIPCFMLIVDTEGLSVLTAVAAGKLSETLVKESLRKFGVESLVSHRTIIIPGYATPLSGRIEEVTGWKVMVGPRDAAEIGEFLEKEWKR
jgi:acetyl-CoA decarbonylase/synthase, CODH/ACS complex subunit gamma